MSKEKDGYDTDDILSQAAEMIEDKYKQSNMYTVETENISDDDFPLTQTTYRSEHDTSSQSEDDICHVLRTLRDKYENVTDSQVCAVRTSIDVSDMGEVGGPCMVGANRPRKAVRQPDESADTCTRNTYHVETVDITDDSGDSGDSDETDDSDDYTLAQIKYRSEQAASNADDQRTSAAMTSPKPGTSSESPGKRRFTTISAESYRQNLQPFRPLETIRKNYWGLRAFKKWRTEMISSSQDEVPGLLDVLKQHEDLLAMSESELNLALSVFVLSLKKQKGGDYQGSSLFQMVCALQRYFEGNGRPVKFLSDPTFNSVKTALDNTMQKVTRKGVGLIKKRADVISLEQEDLLWSKGILGEDKPKKLLRTMFFIIGIHFGLRGGQEQRDLTFSNFEIKKDSGHQYLEYTECVSKTYRGGVKHRKIDPHKARAYENTTKPERCPVRIFQKYRSKLHPRAGTDTIFYFKAVNEIKDENIWYTLQPQGHNTLRNVVKTTMADAGFEGNYTNHSLRATTATRLFNEDVPEQLIRGQTGHRSNAIFAYKRPSDEQLLNVSSILQGSRSQGTTAKPESDNHDSEETKSADVVSDATPCINVTGATSVVFHFHQR